MSPIGFLIRRAAAETQGNDSFQAAGWADRSGSSGAVDIGQKHQDEGQTVVDSTTVDVGAPMVAGTGCESSEGELTRRSGCVRPQSANCEHCGNPLRTEPKRTRRYCSPSCRVMACRSRQRSRTKFSSGSAESVAGRVNHALCSDPASPPRRKVAPPEGTPATLAGFDVRSILEPAGPAQANPAGLLSGVAEKDQGRQDRDAGDDGRFRPADAEHRGSIPPPSADALSAPQKCRDALLQGPALFVTGEAPEIPGAGQGVVPPQDGHDLAACEQPIVPAVALAGSPVVAAATGKLHRQQLHPRFHGEPAHIAGPSTEVAGHAGQGDAPAGRARSRHDHKGSASGRPVAELVVSNEEHER